MLTDIFARRYQDVLLWDDFDERARRLLVQGFRIVSEQLFPYYEDNKVKYGAEKLWDGLNKQLAMELGLEDLSAPAYSYPVSIQGRTTYSSNTYPKVEVCKNFVCAAYDDRSISADRFVKERLSFIEIAFRKRGEEIIRSSIMMDDPRFSWVEQLGRNSITTKRNEEFPASCKELNARFQQAGVPLHYHNGFIQISADKFTADQIERPFWDFVSEPKWKNVDHDMKEAIDLRDSNGRDPAFYAAKALESTVKIISDEKDWTSGEEKGPQQYLDNLGAKKGKFINQWEQKSLKEFFSKVRNPFAHGPGNDQMPELTPQETDWAIGFCMIWIVSLIRRM